MKVILLSLLIASSSFAMNAAPSGGGDGVGTGSRVCLRGQDSAAAEKFYDDTVGILVTRLGLSKALVSDAVAGGSLESIETYLQTRIKSIALFESSTCTAALNTKTSADGFQTMGNMIGAMKRCEVEGWEYDLTRRVNRSAELVRTHKDQVLQALDSKSKEVFVNNAMAGTGEGCK